MGIKPRVPGLSCQCSAHGATTIIVQKSTPHILLTPQPLHNNYVSTLVTNSYKNSLQQIVELWGNAESWPGCNGTCMSMVQPPREMEVSLRSEWEPHLKNSYKEDLMHFYAACLVPLNTQSWHKGNFNPSSVPGGKWKRMYVSVMQPQADTKLSCKNFSWASSHNFCIRIHKVGSKDRQT